MTRRAEVERVAELAAKATPGPWWIDEKRGTWLIAKINESEREELLAYFNVYRRQLSIDQCRHNARYVAALPPELVTHLCAVYAAAVEAEVAIAGAIELVNRSDMPYFAARDSWVSAEAAWDKQATAALARLRGALGETKE